MILRRAIVTGTAVAAVLGGSAVALAASGAAAGHTPVYTTCIGSSHQVERLYGYDKSCPKGQAALQWNEEGPRERPEARQDRIAGASRAAGADRAAGAASAAGTGGTGGRGRQRCVRARFLGHDRGQRPTPAVTPTRTRPSSEHWTSRAGTYLLEANFVATPNEVNAAQIFPQLLVTAGSRSRPATRRRSGMRAAVRWSSRLRANCPTT